VVGGRGAAARAARFTWWLLLAAAVLAVARESWLRSTHLEEYAYGCDPYGYLEGAERVREAWRERRLPDFTLQHPQQRALIEHLARVEPRSKRWDQFVGPHCTHYFERAGHVGLQYPPGTSAMLALFPRDDARNGLHRWTIAGVAATALAVASAAMARGATAGAGAVAAAAVLTLVLFRSHAVVSYSVHALVLPLLAGAGLVFVAGALRVRGRPRAAVAAAFAAGLLLGWGCVVRLPFALLTPAFALLLPLRLWPALATGGSLVALPILGCHQHDVAGAFWKTSYAEIDQAWVGLERAWEHGVPFYLGGGRGAVWHLDVALLAMGFAGVAWRARDGAGPGLCRRVAVAVSLVWLGNVVFYVFHEAQGSYYLAPLALAATWVLAFGCVACETPGEGIVLRPWRRGLALALAFVPGAFAVGRGALALDATPHRDDRLPSLEVPAELREPRAWRWADLTSSTFWYYADLPSYKLPFSSPEIRAEAWRWAGARGDPQYLVLDSEAMRRLADEAAGLGATLVARGEVFGHPYVRLDWEASPEATGQGD
jgi:hypothetical protein